MTAVMVMKMRVARSLEMMVVTKKAMNPETTVVMGRKTRVATSPEMMMVMKIMMSLMMTVVMEITMRVVRNLKVMTVTARVEKTLKMMETMAIMTRTLAKTKTMKMTMGIAMKVAKSQKKIVKMKMERAAMTAMKVTEMILPTWTTMTHTCKALMTKTLTK